MKGVDERDFPNSKNYPPPRGSTSDYRAEFSCLLPCKSSCFSMGEGEKRREMELVIGGGEEVEEEAALHVRNSRRHVFDNLIRD
ncbi:hypothetical protein LguiB_031887 [Lonicera macranthoides]